MSGLLNRIAIIIYPRQPFVDWANSIDAGVVKHELESLRQCPAVFLVSDDPELDTGDEMMKYYMDSLMVGWFESFCEDEAKWPKDRDWEFFKGWFEWIVTPDVGDLEDEEPIKVYPPKSEDLEELGRLRDGPGT